jgi:hypothetical protein
VAEAAGFEWRGRAKWGSEREDPAWSGLCGPPRQIKTDVTNGPNPRSRSPGLDQHSGLFLTITLVSEAVPQGPKKSGRCPASKEEPSPVPTHPQPHTVPHRSCDPRALYVRVLSAHSLPHSTQLGLETSRARLGSVRLVA